VELGDEGNSGKAEGWRRIRGSRGLLWWRNEGGRGPASSEFRREAAADTAAMGETESFSGSG
jgi:hypothetical protein